MIIAIDGPAASGKGTVARLVAQHFNFAHLDTGLLFRAVAKRLLDECDGGADPDRATQFAAELNLDQVADPEPLRTPEVDDLASQVATMPRVRDAIKRFERNFGHSPPANTMGAVLDGRDIGSVIFPDADIKIYVTATPEIRAQRRIKELRARGMEVDAAQINQELLSRDARDLTRTAAPLRQAPAVHFDSPSNTHLLDTTKLSIKEAVTKAIAIIEQHLTAG